MTTTTLEREKRTASSLSDRAMLVDLSISRWQGRKKDTMLTQELADSKGSDVEWGSVTKKLVAKEALAKLVTIEGAAREEHRRRTLPWGEKDERILLHDGYFDYTEALRAFQDQWDPAVKEFIKDFTRFRNEAKVMSPNFRDADYPSADELADRFGFRLKVRPLPDAKDFRVGLGDAEVARIRRAIQEDLDEVVDAAMLDIAKRVQEVVGHMAERLRLYRVGPDGKVEHKFLDSLTANVWELVQVLRTLNITGGTAIPELVDDITADLLPYSPAELRTDPAKRAETAEKAEAILARMEAFCA